MTTLQADIYAKHIAFGGSDLDRADHVRADPDKLAALMTLRARVLQMDGIEPVLDDAARLVWGSLADVAPDAELVFLGLDGEGRGCFAAVPPAEQAGVGPAGPRLWRVMGDMLPAELSTYGIARALTGWHARHRFCPRCGAGTRIAKGGWQRDCVSADCRAQHFPRTDPVVIMTVGHGDSVLLGRQPRFPARRYSALAGFIEPGETIEEAVAREIFEEAGVRVRDVRYVVSQPWPFPSSLMIACHAEADSRELAIDTTELDDARWFTRAEVADAMRWQANWLDGAEHAGDEHLAFLAPPSYAVAWHLIDWWLKQG